MGRWDIGPLIGGTPVPVPTPLYPLDCEGSQRRKKQLKATRERRMPTAGARDASSGRHRRR